MEGQLSQVVSEDGTAISFVSHGDGPPLLLVHGGTADLERWAPVWPLLTTRLRVTAMDRRGRGGSGDAADYTLGAEQADVRVLAEHLSEQAGGPVDVFGHSYGAVCALGAAVAGAPFRRLVLYEPPSSETVPSAVLEHIDGLVSQGRRDEALEFFLVDVIGRTRADVEALRGTPMWERRRSAITTLPREGRALVGLDLASLAALVRQPTLLLLGTESPSWAAAVLGPVAEALPDAQLLRLDGQGHMAIDAVPDVVADAVLRFLA